MSRRSRLFANAGKPGPKWLGWVFWGAGVLFTLFLITFIPSTSWKTVVAALGVAYFGYGIKVLIDD
jgi:hypothetical protein